MVLRPTPSSVLSGTLPSVLRDHVVLGIYLRPPPFKAETYLLSCLLSPITAIFCCLFPFPSIVIVLLIRDHIPWALGLAFCVYESMLPGIQPKSLYM